MWAPLPTPAADEIGLYTLASPLGTVVEILAASFGVRAGASNDLLSVPADRRAGSLEPPSQPMPSSPWVPSPLGARNPLLDQRPNLSKLG